GNGWTKSKRRAAVLALTAALTGVSASASELFAQEPQTAKVAQTAEKTQAAEEAQEAEKTQAAQVGEVAQKTEKTQEAQTAEGGVPGASPEAEAAVDAYLAGKPELAYRLLKELYDANPDSDPPGVMLALLYSNNERFLEMRRELEKTAEDYPDDPEAFLQLAGIDVREGRYLEARLLLDRADELNAEYAARFPESTRIVYLREETLNVRALLAERRGRYDEAAELTQKVVDANPKNVQARWNLGYLAVKRNLLDDAEKAFDKAAELDERLWPGWLQTATTLDAEDRLDEAFERLQSQGALIETAARRERAQLARLYLRWNKLDEAAALVGELEAEGKNDFDGWALRGWVALYAGGYAVAEDAFRRATFIDGTSFEASNGLALALLDQRNKEKLAQARAVAAKNYRAYPDSQDAAATYAWTLFLSGAAREADAIFGPMLDSGEFSPTVAYYLAEIANVREDKSLALTLLDLALRSKGNFPKRAAAVELRAIIAPEKKEENAADAETSPEVAETPQSAEKAEVAETSQTAEKAEAAETAQNAEKADAAETSQTAEKAEAAETSQSAEKADAAETSQSAESEAKTPETNE
ncbi:MAG: tetratricopeptide repeat protein, partial [Thermoguttaceae bacterium]|nr:tetratricopeptide repeat protein [Thermoguttaceae bacterium]